jgi:hypothetical protein
MEQSELLIYLCRHLERIGIRYLITGSQATIAFGEPRFTNDIDVVVDLDPSELESFCDRFPENDYYLSREAARQALSERGMFNIIHPMSGLKIDVIVSKQTPFDLLRFQRGIRIPIADDCEAVFTSPEDIAIKKMEWHRMGGGERHLDDIAGILRVRGESLDREYIVEQASQLQILDIWQTILDRLEKA